MRDHPEHFALTLALALSRERERGLIGLDHQVPVR